MRNILVVLLLVLLTAGCQSRRKTVNEQMTGNWLVVYPEYGGEGESDAYDQIQDSLMNGKALKLLTFQENGRFIQWDSTGQQGKWGVIDRQEVVVSGGGKGFGNFRALYADGKEQEALLREKVFVGNKETEVVWHLKKITDKEAAQLFLPEMNEWRRTPSTPETTGALRKRLSAMLRYYAGYFKLISGESNYFMPMRVMLPLKFYQHAIGMREFDPQHRFVSLFANETEARNAFELLKMTVNNSDDNYPEGDSKSYGLEYAYMLGQLAEEILK